MIELNRDKWKSGKPGQEIKGRSLVDLQKTKKRERKMTDKNNNKNPATTRIHVMTWS